MLRATFLPARFGDAIWIEFGDSAAPRRVLIDGGTRGTRSELRRLLGQERPPGRPHVDLLVITHVDRDHIEGVLGLLEEAEELKVGDVWFNGWGHLSPETEDEPFGPVQGEKLSKRILELELPWNEAFDGKAVVISDDGPLPRRSIDGLELTLLGPTRAALERLKPVWEREVRAAGLDPGFGLEVNDEEPEGDEGFGPAEIPDVEELAASDFTDDRSEANGSSIALLAEHDGHRLLLAGDTPAGALQAAVERHSPDEALAIDLFKISHHGSRNTTSRGLLELVRCPTFVFSTNGSIFKHPHAEAVARVIDVAGGPELVFNYRSPRNEIWDLASLRQRHGYRARFPEAGATGITLSF